MHRKFLAFFLAPNKLLFLLMVSLFDILPQPREGEKAALFNKIFRSSTEFYFPFTFTKMKIMCDQIMPGYLLKFCSFYLCFIITYGNAWEEEKLYYAIIFII